MNDKSYYVLLLIKRSKEPIPAKTIKEQLEQFDFYLDIKTVYEYIRKINAFYRPILNDNYIHVKRRTGYYIGHEYFDDGQLQYMIDTIQSNTSLCKEESDKLVQQLLSLSSENQKERMTLQLEQNKQDNPLFTNLTTLVKAINLKHNVYFEYVDYAVYKKQLKKVPSKNGNVEVDGKSYYKVSPYKIIMNDQKYYLLAYCDKRKKSISTYRVDRMNLVRKHRSPFIDIQEQFDMEKEQQQAINMYINKDKIRLELKFHKSILREVVDRFGSDYEVQEIMNNYYVAAIDEVTYSQGLIGWLFMLQDHVEVLQPYEVRSTMKKQIAKIKKIYQDPKKPK